jgi:hypothetical protein
MRPAKAALSASTSTGLATKLAGTKRRPVQGNSPNDRVLRGPDCNRPKRVCVDFLPAIPSLPPPRIQEIHGMRFLRHAESIGPMSSPEPIKAGAGVPPPVGRLRRPTEGRDGRSAPCSSSAMSSDRLFLDRVARQQSPSPLHRHPQINMHSSPSQGKGDISILRIGGHFYFASTQFEY